VGALYSGREGLAYHNRLGGVDAFYRPLDALTLQAQYVRSETEYPDDVAQSFDQQQGSFTGDALQGTAQWSSRDYLGQADFRRTSPGFRADAGFVTQAGVTGGNAMVMRRWWGEDDSWYQQLRLQVGTWHNRDFQGNQMNGGMWFGLHYFGPAQSFLGIWPNLFQTEHFAGVTYEGLSSVFFTANLRPSGSFSLNVNGNVGDAVDFANERLGSEVRVSPNLGLRVGRNFDLNLQQSYQRLRYEGQDVFTAHLTQVRGVYNFSARSFVRAIVQFRQTDRNPELYNSDIDQRNRAVFTQFLYAYKVNPQTVLFAGYTDDRNALTDIEGRHTDLTQKGRAFFLKLGYAWRP
jgi:hypothetical protein